MSVGSLLHLINVLARAEFEDILGTPESSWVDFKRAPYPLDTDRSKWELAKDVCAFANTGAGVILIGIETELDNARRIETASARRPTSVEAVRIQAVRDVIRDWIYPRVRDFDVQWYGDTEETELGYLLLHIPAQAESEKPFVVRRMADGDEKGSVGIAERDGADTVWWTAERMHHQLQQPRRQPEPAPERVTSPSQPFSDRLDEHISLNETAQGWETEPILHLQAIPPREGQRLPNFYNRDGLWGALNEPEQVRPGGWSLRTPFEPEVDEGALVCRSPGIDVLRLEPDGLFTVSGIANDDFLCWAMSQGRSPDSPLPLNPIALAEWVYSFFMFVNGELKDFIPGQWTYRLVALRLQTNNIGLFGELPRQMFPRTAIRASSDRWIESFPEDELTQGRETFGFGSLSVGHEAFIALDRLYGLFGLGNDVIPFTSDEQLVITAEILDNL